MQAYPVHQQGNSSYSMIPSKYETIFQQITENSFLEWFFGMELGWSKYVGSVASKCPLKKTPGPI
jgi:hypothetical protein